MTVSLSEKTIDEKVTFVPSPCAICETFEQATEIYPANFTANDFNTAIFSARRLPDRIHYRIVKCNQCGLIRSTPLVSTQLLESLYTDSHFDYNEEVDSITETYGRYLSQLERYGVLKGTLLEIGCGNGFSLEEALRQGYREVYGVEPSVEAIDKASPHIRPFITPALMQAGLFPEASFDVICLFQVLDHIPNPNDVLAECHKILKPGGFILCLNHNINAISAKILRERSPIVDIEHTYLYSPTTIKRLFKKHRFIPKCIKPVWNSYSLHYLIWLLPLPTSIKRLFLWGAKCPGIKRIHLTVPLGNLYIIAQKLP